MKNLVQIQDNSKSNKVVGIDFGTTFSLAAYSENYKPRIITDSYNNQLIPSRVTFLNSSEYSIGDEYLFNNKSLIQIKSIKRLLGKTFDEAMESDGISDYLKKLLVKDDNVLKLRIYEKLLTPVEIASLIFSKIKLQIDNYFDENITKAIVTVPAYFDDMAKNDVKNSAKIAGIDVLRIISEPIAAGYAYSIEKQNLKSYMVFDFGGGTLDVSILKVNEGIVQVVATSGDANLGGDDIDIALANYIKLQYGSALIDEFKDNDLVNIAKKIKETFLENEDFYLGQDKFGQNKISVSEFNKVIFSIIKNTIDIAKKVYIESKSELDAIILVGGSSKIKLLQDMLINEFSLPLNNNIDQDKVVAMGAAMYAENLSHDRKNLLLDVVPLSFGIETFGGAVEKIINRNSPVPTYASRHFTNYVNDQDAIIINIIQGEREIVSKSKSIGKIELEIEKSMAGSAKIEVIFYVSEDGILEVKVIDSKTGKFKEVKINTRELLSVDEINNMILDSFYNAEQDIKIKNAIETKNKGNVFLKNVKFIVSEMKNLNYDDKSFSYESIDKLIQDLEVFIKNNNTTQVSETIKKIENGHNDIFEFYMQNKVNSILNKTKIR